MRYVLSALSAAVIFFTTSPFASKNPSTRIHSEADNKDVLNEINFQDEGENGRMPSVVFKSQSFCRVELKDFDFAYSFSVLSANVYFTGANFSGVERGYINSNSLKPIAKLMERCGPGSIVTFDNVKVIGTDKEVRTIPGASYVLY